MALDALARASRGLDESQEIDVGAEVHEPRGREGAHARVLPDPAQRVRRYRVGWAVVYDQRRAGRARLRVRR